MRGRRFFFFFLSIVVGVGIGLVIAWGVNPAPMREARLSALRSDFRTDLILMVAESYAIEGDLITAYARLAPLGEESPTRAIQLAILSARDLGYAPRDIETLAKLSQALQTYTPVPTPGGKP